MDTGPVATATMASAVAWAATDASGTRTPANLAGPSSSSAGTVISAPPAAVRMQRPGRCPPMTAVPSASTTTTSGTTTYATVSVADVAASGSYQPPCRSVHRNHPERVAMAVATTR